MTKQERPYALAFETSTALGGVALAHDGRLVAAVALDRARAHARDFLPATQSVCVSHGVAARDIGEVYVSSGPGSFTGLRIGITSARMLALAVGARLVSVPTLEVIAQNAASAEPRPDRVAVLLDAKRGHVYASAFNWNGESYVAITQPVEAEPRTFLSSQPESCAVLGEGVLYHRAAVEAAGQRVLPESLFPPRPQGVLELGYARARRGEFTPPRLLVPTYIRPPEAEEVWQRRHG